MSEEQSDPDHGGGTSEEDPPREARGPTGGATGFSNRPDPGREEPDDGSPAQRDFDWREPDWWLRKKVLVSAGALALLFLASLALFWPASSASLEADPTATEITVDLAEKGIEDAVVDVSDERALVRYNLPTDMSTEESWVVVLEELLQHAPSSDVAVLQVYEDGEPTQEIEADMDDVEAYFDARISWQEFRERITVRSVG